MSMFKKAVRSQAKLKLALAGPSGAGKTYSALRLASGLGKRIAVLDTENGSASLYSDRFDFDVINLTPPFSTERYEAAIKEAVELKYDALILDSISHAWNGEGGLLQQKEQIDARGRGNSYTNWAAITKKDEHFRSVMLHAPIHIIATMRSKQEYIQAEENGKKVIKKVGMAPVQRDGIEYEFTVVLDLAMNHEAEASKDRTGLFPTGKYFKISEDTGKALMEWLGKGEAPKPPKLEVVADPPAHPDLREETVALAAMVGNEPPDTSDIPPEPNILGVTEKQVTRLFAIAHSKNIPRNKVIERLGELYAKAPHELTRDEYFNVCNAMLEGRKIEK